MTNVDKKKKNLETELWMGVAILILFFLLLVFFMVQNLEIISQLTLKLISNIQ